MLNTAFRRLLRSVTKMFLKVLRVLVCTISFSGLVVSDENITNIIKETEERINRNRNKSETNVNTCGGIFTQPQFLIESPNYPSNYPNGLNCLYIFKGAYCRINYTLQFLDFSIENSLGCGYDRFEIRDKDALCGNRSGIKTYTAKTGTLEINFKTNEETNGRGFRILVSRSLCLKTENDTKNFVDSLIPKQQACCAATYNTKHFFISSPGFPYSQNNPTECTFTIYRANPNVCRLRINMKFFWIGIQDSTCSQGYLQIDGKLICGCHTDLKLVSSFDGTLGNTKVFHFKNTNALKSIFTGFAIEIIQDECPKRYLPESRIQNDQINRIAWPNISRDVQGISENTEIFEPVDLGFKPRVVKHVYYFASPDEGYNYDFNPYFYDKPRDVEESSYIETSDLNDFFPNGNDRSKCRNWDVLQWSLLNKDPVWMQMSRCNEIYNNPVVSNCKEYNFIKGYFQSPGYPHYYPKNLNLCYRFTKQRGFCKIRLVMLDFQLEDSFDCSRDYLLLNNNFRYCGQSLFNTFTLFDMSSKQYEEIKFLTDSQIGGRGFRGIYEQLPCSGFLQPENPTVSYPPSFPIYPTPIPPKSCFRNVQDEYFTIDIYDYGREMCDFKVIRNNEQVCQLEVSLVTFDFPCEYDYLLINGKKYCGKLSGMTLMFDFDSNEILISYNRVVSRVGSGLKLHLVGRQINDCEVNLPPVQRIGIIDRIGMVANKATNKSTNGFMTIMNNGNDISVILKKQFKEVCGVVMNLKTKNIAPSICDVIQKSGENITCSTLSENTIYVPYNTSDKLELKFTKIETVHDIEFKEITCDNKFVL